METKKLKRVFLIDDDESVNFLNKVIIQRKKCADEILEYQKAQEALDFLENKNDSNGTPDLIFLDINMPEMNGWEFMDRFKNLPKMSCDPVIVILTSSISPVDEQRAAGIEEVAEFRSKPLSFDILDEIIESHFR